MKKLLIVDDEIGIRESLKNIFKREEFQLLEAGEGITAQEILEKERPEIVILDIRIPGKDGLSLLKWMRERKFKSEVIVITGYADIELAVQSTKLGAFDFIEKPFSSERILITVKNAFDRYQLKKIGEDRIEEAKERYRIIGESEEIKKLKEQIKRVAKTNSTVLILGESGTGKELVARNIHLYSPRRYNTFVHLNCAAIPEELVESELFGHRKGSFTGAIENKIGKFKEADKGTIFLDEIGDLSLRAQAKVLRVIENGEIQRIGENKTENVDVRVLAATNKELSEEIKKGKFREDLYFRLNVVILKVPPLRERKEDIPHLIEFFSSRFSYEMGIEKKVFEPRLIEYLKERDWKGNVRELRNFVERVYVFVQEKSVKLDMIFNIFEDETFSFPQPKNFKNYKNYIQEAERRFIEQKLAFYNYNVAKTAREIGMSRVNLMKKIKDLGIKSKGVEERSLPQDAEEESPNSTGQGAS